ncbi:MAG: hypothetical protein PF795_09540, partial [Kiritimatiellae bacterium]|nr:hypothetical protein [Kiritimatiellia bacterium]
MLVDLLPDPDLESEEWELEELYEEKKAWLGEWGQNVGTTWNGQGGSEIKFDLSARVLRYRVRFNCLPENANLKLTYRFWPIVGDEMEDERIESEVQNVNLQVELGLMEVTVAEDGSKEVMGIVIPENGEYKRLVRVEVLEGCGSGPNNFGFTFGTGFSSLRWWVSLGKAANGRGVGNLRLEVPTIDENTSTPVQLRYDGGIDPEITLIKDEWGTLLQVLSPETFVDIVTVDEQAYEIRFYPRDGAFPTEETLIYGIDYEYYDHVLEENVSLDSQEFSYQTGRFESNADPVSVWRIENPDGPGIHERITITQTVGGENNEYEFTQTPADEWELIRGGGARKDTRKVTTLPNGDKEILVTILNPDDSIASKVLTTERSYLFGPRIVERVVDPDGEAHTTTYTYYDSEINDGRAYSRLKSTTDSLGSWSRHEYDALGRKSKTVSGYRDALPGAADGESRVTTYEYSPDGLTTTIVETVPGAETSRSYLIRTADHSQTTHKRCTLPGAGIDAPSNQTTITHYVTEGEYKGRVHTIEHPDGRITRYEYETDPEGNRIITTWRGQTNPQDEFIWGSKTVEVTAPFGRNVSSERLDIASGQTLSLRLISEMDARGRPLRIDYLDGTYETLSYTCCGVENHRDREGIITSYTYNELGRQETATRAGVTTHTEYDALGRVTFTWQTPENDLNAIMGKAAAAPVYNGLGELIETTDPAGRVTTYNRTTDNGIVTRTTTLPGGATLIDKSYIDGTPIERLGTGQRHTTHSETWTDGERVAEQAYTDNPDDFSRTIHNFSGRVIRTERPSPTGTGLAVLENHYEPGTQRLIKTVDPAGLATLYFYNDQGEQYLTVVDVDDDGEIDWSGPDRIRMTETEYTTYNNEEVHETRSYTWEEDGDPDSTLVSVTRSTHDGLQSWSESFGQVTHSETVRDSQNATVTRTTTAPDGTYSVSVTVNGLPQYSARYNANDAQLNRQDFEYDDWNRRNQVIDAGTGITAYSFHEDGSVATVIQQPGTALEQSTNTLSSGLDALGYTTQGGRIEVVTLPDNKIVTREYHPTGELKTQYGSRQYPVAYTYDYAGRNKSLTTWQDFAGEADAAVTTWNYNNAGVLESKRYPDSLGPDYEYDVRGLLTKRTHARGTETDYVYNEQGELTHVNYPDSDTPSVVNDYDRLGRLVQIQDASGTREYEFEDFQPVREEYIAGLLSGWKIERDRDNLQRPDSVDLQHADVSKHGITYGYESHSSRLETVTGHGVTNTYGYQPNRNLLSTLDQGGIQDVSYTHDNLKRLSQIETSVDNTVISSHDYHYNLANQRFRADLADGTYWEYAYDDLGQVTGGVKKDSSDAVIPGYRFGYTFDDIGNRETFVENGRTTNYAANLLNQYSSINRPALAHLRGERGNTSTLIDVERMDSGLGPQEATYSNNLWYKEKPVTDLVSRFEITAAEGGNRNRVSGSMYTPVGLNEPEFDADGNLLKDHLWEYTWNSDNRL